MKDFKLIKVLDDRRDREDESKGFIALYEYNGREYKFDVEGTWYCGPDEYEIFAFVKNQHLNVWANIADKAEIDPFMRPDLDKDWGPSINDCIEACQKYVMENFIEKCELNNEESDESKYEVTMEQICRFIAEYMNQVSDGEKFAFEKAVHVLKNSIDMTDKQEAMVRNSLLHLEAFAKYVDDEEAVKRMVGLECNILLWTLADDWHCLNTRTMGDSEDWKPENNVNYIIEVIEK